MTTDLDAFERFDRRLAERLVRLDAAIPAMPLPSPAAVRFADRARTRRRRRLPILLAAAALLATAGLVGAERTLYPDLPEPRLDAALAEITGESGCQSAAEVRPKVEARLAELGYQGWIVAPRPGSDTAACVFPGVVSPLHEVALFPGAGQQLADALQQVALELEQQCLDRRQAFELVDSTVRSVGTEPDFSIHADPWGPTGGPIDKIQLYEQHVRDGCFVFVGTGRDGSGHAELYLWGPWP
jgi:hypothetical protein